MTDFGKRWGIGDMLKADYDPVIACIQALAAAHKTQHQNGGTDEINATGLTGVPVAPLLVDGVAGRVLRSDFIYVSDGSNPDTIYASLAAQWNSSPINDTDNVIKNGTTGVWHVDLSGQIITILNTGLTGNAVGVIAVTLWLNTTGTTYFPYITKSDQGIAISVYDVNFIVPDLTVVADAGYLAFTVTYLTDA